MADDKQISDELYGECKDHAGKIIEGYSTREEMFDAMEDMFFLKGSDLPDQAWIKETISPDPRNALLGAVRMLAAADPNWSVPAEVNSKDVNSKSSPIEKTAAAIWYAASRVNRKPIHYDLILSGLLYGEEHLAVISTKDMKEAAQTDAQKRRAERAANMTPVLFDVLNPRYGFPEFDRLGLSAYTIEQEMKVAQFRTMYPEWSESNIKDLKPYESITFKEYWNQDHHCVWTKEYEDKPIMKVEHTLDNIPIIVQVTEGSEMFQGDDQDTRQPFLYTLWKSNIWNRQNLSMTVLYSVLFAIGSNPLFLYKRNRQNAQAGRTIQDVIDYDVPGGGATIDMDEDFGALAKSIIDPSMLQGLDIANEKLVESTIYKQTLGEPLGANAPFSMVALLSQAGRLPLVPYQRTTNFALSDAMHLAFDMIRKEGGKKNVLGEDGMQTLNAADIPEQFEIFAKLDIEMPQDERQNVIMATQATFGDNPLVSMKYARENWLRIGQSDDMQEEIWGERWSNQQAMLEYQRNQLIIAQQQQMIQMGMTQQAQAGAMAMGAGPMGPAQPQSPMPIGPTDPMMQMPGEAVGRIRQLGNTTAQPGVPGIPLEGPLQPPGAAPLGQVPGTPGSMPFARPEE